MHIRLRQEDQTAIRINFVMKCRVSRIYKTLVNLFLVWVTLTNILRDKLMVLRVYMADMQTAKEIRRKEDR